MYHRNHQSFVLLGCSCSQTGTSSPILATSSILKLHYYKLVLSFLYYVLIINMENQKKICEVVWVIVWFNRSSWSLDNQNFLRCSFPICPACIYIQSEGHWTSFLASMTENIAFSYSHLKYLLIYIYTYNIYIYICNIYIYIYIYIYI